MKIYKTIIDLEKCFGRSNDIFDKSAYPYSLKNAKGVLVKEDRNMKPRYQARPGPLWYIMHGAGEINDKILKKAEEACGMNESPEIMFGLRRAVYGLNRGDCWGRNLFYSCLIISDNIFSSNPLAIETDQQGWHYLFKPGMIRLGKSGRVLQNKAGEIYEEEIFIKITPDLVYDAITNEGLLLEKIGIIKANGDTDIVYDEEIRGEGYIREKFPKSKPITGKSEDANFKRIDLTKIVEEEGFSVLSHKFTEQTKTSKGLYVFDTQTRFESLKELVDTSASVTDNIVWKLASLNLLEGNPNNFVKNATWRLYELPMIREDSVHLGGTGREVKIADNKSEDGREWPSNWQSEYISIEVDENMVVSALFGLGEELKQIVTYDKTSCTDDVPWEIVYQKGTNITPAKREIFKVADTKPKIAKPPIPKELEDLLKPKGLVPTDTPTN